MPWFMALAALALVPALPVWARLGTWFYGIAGQGRGEFETWRWLHWWMHRLLEFHARDASGTADLLVRILGMARDLDIGNMADTLFISFPLEALFGNPAAHNLKILLILVGNALAAGVLARALGARRQALFVTAAGLALSPFVWTEVQECRMAEAILVFVFLGAAAWLRLQEDPTPQWGALFGFALGLALVFYWFYGLWLAMWCLLTLGVCVNTTPVASPGLFRPCVVAGSLICHQQTAASAPSRNEKSLGDARSGYSHRPLAPSRRLLPALAVAALATAAVSLPFLSPYLLGEGSKSPVPFGQSFPALQDLELYPREQLGPIGPSLVMSQSLSPWWPLDPSQPHGLSLTWLALAVLGARQASRRWWLPAATFWLLTLGPYLRWGADCADLRLPYTWFYQWVPAWSRLFWPWRMAPFVFLSLAPLVLEGARRFRRPVVAFTVLLLAELTLRGTLFLTAAPVVPDPFYQILGPQDGVVELSYPWNSAMAGYQQAFHGRPTLGTLAQAWPHYGQPPDSLLADPRRFREEPFLAWLEQVREGPAGPAPPADFLVRSGYFWLVVHTDWPGSQGLAVRVKEGLGTWDYRDQSVTAWRLDRQ